MFDLIRSIFKKKSTDKFIVTLRMKGKDYVQINDWYYDTEHEAKNHAERMEKKGSNKYKITKIVKGLI